MSTIMEVVIDFEYLKGRQDEMVVKELSVASENVSDSFRFERTYDMMSNGSGANGLNSTDIHIPYYKLYTVATEAVAGFPHFHAYGDEKWKYLAELLGRPIHNLKDLECPAPSFFNHRRWCSLPCHKFPNIHYATKTAHSLFDWTMNHLQTNLM